MSIQQLKRSTLEEQVASVNANLRQLVTAYTASDPGPDALNEFVATLYESFCAAPKRIDLWFHPAFAEVQQRPEFALGRDSVKTDSDAERKFLLYTLHDRYDQKVTTAIAGSGDELPIIDTMIRTVARESGWEVASEEILDDADDLPEEFHTSKFSVRHLPRYPTARAT